MGLRGLFAIWPDVLPQRYPDEVRRARLFQLATLSCIFIYVIISPELIPSTRLAFARIGPPGQEKYALIAGSHTFTFGGYASEPASKKSLTERRQANVNEFERLRLWSEKLRLRKRDLLNTDEAGALAYNRDATDYNAALDQANSEKFSLAMLSK